MPRVTHKYMAQEVSDQEREATFSARKDTLQILLDGLRSQIDADRLRGWLLTGPRGAGKSTLVQMVRQRINADPQLSRHWQPIVLPEELPHILNLRDLWVAVLEQISETSPSARSALNACQTELDDARSEELAVTGLKELSQQTGKRLVLALENFADLVDVLGDDVVTRFGRQLTKNPFAILLATSVGEINLPKSLHPLLTPIPLERIGPEEVWAMIASRAARDGHLELLSQNQKLKLAGIVAAITRLTGGNPRLVVMLYEIIALSEIENAVVVLRQLMDELTPLYDGLLRRLSAQQRKVVHALMHLGGTGKAVTPAEIATEARLDPVVVRSQLVRLRESGCVSLDGGGKGREAFYSVTDRLFATWYQLRYFPSSRRRIEIFVEVLRAWFTPEQRFHEFQRAANSHRYSDPETANVELPYLLAALEGSTYYYQAQDRLEGDQTEERYLADAPADVQAACRNIRQQYWSDDSQPAGAIYQTLLDRSDLLTPLRAMLLRRLGNIFFESGQTERAIAAHTACIELPYAPPDQVAIALVNRGCCHSQAGRTDEAIADYTHCIEPPNAPPDQVAIALVNRGCCHSQAGRTDEAIADYTHCIELPNAPPDQVAMALFNRGYCHGQAGRTDEEIADYKRCIELPNAPPDQVAKALFNRGCCHGQAGRRDEAIADYKRCIELPNAPPDQVAKALFNLGCCHGHAGRTDEAIADYKRCIELPYAPPDQVAIALVTRAEWYAYLGRPNDAIVDYSAAIAEPFGLLEWMRDSPGAAARMLRAACRPEFRAHWPEWFEAIDRTAPEDLRERLDFFRPVAQILRGADRAILRKLAPEEREFAEEVLRRFDRPGGDSSSAAPVS